MLPEGFKKRLNEKMTPNRRRFALAFSVCFVIWTTIGFFILPGIIQSQASAYVKENLGLDLSIGKVEFNPWRLAIRIDDLAIQDPANANEKLIGVRSIYVNADILSSLWVRGADLAEVDLLAPYVNAHILEDGNINLMKLVPQQQDDDNSDSSVNWRIGLLGIHQGQVDFHDESLTSPFSTQFSPLNITLANLSSNPAKDGGYSLQAETGEGEKLAWKGVVALNPVRSEGELHIINLKATTPWHYLQDALPVTVDKGLISVSGKYSLVAGDEVSLELKDGHVTVDNLSLSHAQQEPLEAGWDKLDIQGITALWPAQAASFDHLSLAGFHLADKKTAQALTGFAELTLDNANFAPDTQEASLGSLTLKSLTLAGEKIETPLLALPSFVLGNIKASLNDQTASIAQVLLSKGVLDVAREKSGSLDIETRVNHLADRLARISPPDTSSSQTSDTSPWHLKLGKLDLEKFRIGFTDRSLAEPFQTTLENIDLHLIPQQEGQHSHQLNGSMEVGSGGSIALNGNFSETPVAANINVQVHALKLPPLAPLATDIARLAIEKGALNLNGQLKFQQDKTSHASFLGNIVIDDFAANDLDMDERFLAWKQLAVNGINWQLAPEQLTIREIVANKPFIRAIINEDQTINLSQVVVGADSTGIEESAAPTKATAQADAPYPLKIDHIKVVNGSMLFADMSLRPQFATGIESLDGDIKGLSSKPGSRATIALKGQVDEYGKADISGTLNPLAGDLYTDISVKFNNVELTTLTPYSSKFAGYRIDKGKLSLDLNYKINDRKLNASNKVVLDQLTLGEKVKSPDATSLPLKLAVAILKDKNGVINIDLPVSGSLDDPKFKVGPLIWKTLLNLLTKAATAPFSMVAGMFGSNDQMDALAFAAGSTVLTDESKEKLGNIASALTQRPALALEIQGTFDPAADASAIRTQKFDQGYLRKMAGNSNSRKVLEDLYREKLGSEALAQQRAMSLKPAGSSNDKGNLQLATDIYEQNMRKELIARETVLEGDLRQLALDRARTIRNQLIEAGQVEESRVFVIEPATTQASDSTVISKLNLTAP